MWGSHYRRLRLLRLVGEFLRELPTFAPFSSNFGRLRGTSGQLAEERSGGGERLRDDLEALGQQFVGDGERRQEPDDIAKGSTGEHDDARGVCRGRDPPRECGVGCPGGGVDELDG